MNKLQHVKEKGLTLKTPQSLIHIKHTISLLQYKLWILLLQELKRQFDTNQLADEKGFRSLSVQSIANNLGYLPKKQDIWNEIIGISDQKIAFNILEKNGEAVNYGARFISEFKVSKNRIWFKFPSVLEDAMYGLDNAENIFHLLNWDIFNHFSGKYEAIIYKLCKDYIGVGRTPKMTIPLFRDYMGINKDEYPEFKKLNVRVISEPIARINESPVSDILVDVVFTKNGRNIEELYFIVKPKRQNVLSLAAPESHPAFTLTKVKISGAAQQGYLSKMSAEQIQASIERANDYADDLQKQGKTVRYGAIYKKALEENWGAQHAEQKVLAAQVPDEKPQPKQVNTPPKSESETRLLARFTSLADAEKQALIEDYLQALKGLKKAQMITTYAGEKLAIVNNAHFASGFYQHLAKSWESEQSAPTDSHRNNKRLASFL